MASTGNLCINSRCLAWTAVIGSNSHCPPATSTEPAPLPRLPTQLTQWSMTGRSNLRQCKWPWTMIPMRRSGPLLPPRPTPHTPTPTALNQRTPATYAMALLMIPSRRSWRVRREQVHGTWLYQYYHNHTDEIRIPSGHNQTSIRPHRALHLLPVVPRLLIAFEHTPTMNKVQLEKTTKLHTSFKECPIFRQLP